MQIQIEKKTKSGEEMGGGCMALFGLPFFLVGFFVMGLGLSQLWEYHQTGAWQSVPATIDAAEIVTSRGSKGSTIYRITGAYSYTLGGKSFRGKRIVVDESTSTGREASQEMFAILDRHRTTKKPLNILVNPRDPQESVVFRRISTSMAILPPFGAVFLLAGLGLMISGVWSYRKGLIRETQLRLDPRRPWLADPDTRGFVLRSGSLGTVLVTWAISLFLLLFLSVFAIAIGGDPDIPLVVKGVLSVFALLGLAMLGGAIYSSLQYMKYGQSTLLLSQMPLAVGGSFSAVLMVKRHLITDDGCQMTVKCVKSVTTGSGKNSHTDRTELFNRSVTVKADLIKPQEGRSAIPLQMEIPGGLPGRVLEGRTKITWTLSAAAETPGIDFAAEFELPVYEVPDESLIEKRSS